MKKILLAVTTMILMSGCSGHTTSMQDVRAYCRSVTTDMECESQDAICADYSEVTLRSYSTAKECRQACENVQDKSTLNTNLQSCLGIYQAVVNKCTEFCNDNYE